MARVGLEREVDVARRGIRKAELGDAGRRGELVAAQCRGGLVLRTCGDEPHHGEQGHAGHGDAAEM